MVPRDGLPQANRINRLRSGATDKRRTLLQGFAAASVAPFWSGYAEWVRERSSWQARAGIALEP